MRTRLKRARAAALCLALLLAGCGGAGSGPTTARQQPTDAPAPVETRTRADVKLDVPYVPTPEVVVEKMLRMAKVGKDDVVYDLGCGDGRIVVTAAQKYGARGVGYDLNPQRINESNANARNAGVNDRVRFVQGDLFEADLREATVVTLYLLPDVNLKLRPKLFAELRPGTRVVSHNYDMGDWEPLEVAEIEVGGATHYVYYWIIPEKR
jgi:SAM-dependent methyltransferase